MESIRPIRNTTTRQLAADIQRQSVLHGLRWEDVKAKILGRCSDETGLIEPTPDFTRILEVGQQIFETGTCPSDLWAVRKFLVILKDFDIETDASLIAGKLVRFGAIVRDCFALCLMALVGYLVIGGVLTTGGNALARLAGLAVLLAVLAAVEGLHTCVTMLKLKNLSALRATYPRAFQIHRLFKSDAGVKRFLAGRQLFVIAIVFFVAQMTTFAKLDAFPGTHTKIPELIRVPLVGWGLAGALFVLWVGQLAPQFYAARHPVRFLNLPGMDVLFHAALLLEAIGFARTGDWLIALARGSQAIPPSPEEVFAFAAAERGFGALTVRNTVAVAPEAIQSDYEAVYLISGQPLTSFLERGVIHRQPCRTSHSDANLISTRDGETHRIARVFEVDEDKLDDGSKRAIQTVSCNAGYFASDDVVSVAVKSDYDALSSCCLDVLVPTKRLTAKIVFEGAPHIFNCTLQLFEDTGTEGYIQKLSVPLPTRVDEQGRLSFSLDEHFPRQGNRYLITWTVQYE